MSEYFDVELKCVNLAKIEEDLIPDGFKISCQSDDVSIALNLSRKNEDGVIKLTEVYFSWLMLEFTSKPHSEILKLTLSRAIKLLKD